MQRATIAGGLTLAYEDDWLGPPWKPGEPLLLIHGMGESSRAWYGWVPILATQWRVIRPDLPGFGASPVPADYQWTAARLGADIGRFMDALGIERAILVAAKYGGSAALKFAADQPGRVKALAVFGSPARAPSASGVEFIRAHGMRAWAESTMRGRLGSQAPEAQVRWWIDGLMGATDDRAGIGAGLGVAALDIERELAQITAPTLVVTTRESGLQAVAAVRRYQERIPDSRLVVIDSDCYHIAATEPERCARLAADFLRGVAAGRPFATLEGA